MPTSHKSSPNCKVLPFYLRLYPLQDQLRPRTRLMHHRRLRTQNLHRRRWSTALPFAKKPIVSFRKIVVHRSRQYNLERREYSLFGPSGRHSTGMFNRESIPAFHAWKRSLDKKLTLIKWNRRVQSAGQHWNKKSNKTCRFEHKPNDCNSTLASPTRHNWLRWSIRFETKSKLIWPRWWVSERNATKSSCKYLFFKPMQPAYMLPRVAFGIPRRIIPWLLKCKASIATFWSSFFSVTPTWARYNYFSSSSMYSERNQKQFSFAIGWLRWFCTCWNRRHWSLN